MPQESYPTPDRSDQSPALSKSDPDGQIDIGWGNGKLRDGRPFRVECWAQFGVTMLTYFFSVLGLEEHENADFTRLLVAEGLIELIPGTNPTVDACRIIDPAGNELWSVNVVVATEDGPLVRDLCQLRGYGAA